MALDKEEVAAIVRSRIARSTGLDVSTISRERTRVLEYYNGELPKPLHKGNSKYVSMDVFDSVEMMTAQLLETFSGTLQPVRFLPQGAQDVEEARIATEVVNFVIDQQNEGFDVKQAVIKDGLLGRMGVAKVWWEKCEEEEELAFEAEDGAVDNSALQSFMGQNPDAEPTDGDFDTDTGIVKSATFKKTTDTSQVRVIAVPPEEFGLSQGVRSMEEADLVFHRKEVTPAELVAMGYSQAVVDDLPTGREWLNTSEDFVRSGDVDTMRWAHSEDEQKAGRKLEVFECYTKLDPNEEGGTSSKSTRSLWKVLVCGGTVLDMEQVKRIPFVLFTPLPVAHTVWGRNYAAMLIPVQNARTALRRSIIDHAVITTNPRWEVFRGALSNPTELTESKIGGVVNTNKPIGMGIGVLPQPNLNPYIFQTIQALDDDKEELTGISKLSQGLNKDALSKQNSGDMVEQLVSMSQVRQKVIARRLAEFHKKLYLSAYQLVVENASKEFIISVAGNWVQVDPTSLAVRKELLVDFALGYGEKQREAAKYTGIFQALTQASQSDPGIAQAFGTQQKYSLISRALEAQGIKDVETVLPDPSKLPPPQPNPHEQMALQKGQADVQMQQAQAQATVAKIQRETQKDQMQHELEMAKLQMEMQKIQSQLQLDVRKQAHIEVVDAATIRMEQEEIASGNAQGVITSKT